MIRVRDASTRGPQPALTVHRARMTGATWPLIVSFPGATTREPGDANGGENTAGIGSFGRTPDRRSTNLPFVTILAKGEGHMQGLRRTRSRFIPSDSW